MVRQARNLSKALAQRAQPVRLPVRDRDTKFTQQFDEVFRSEGIRVTRRRSGRHRPLRSPRASWGPFVASVRIER